METMIYPGKPRGPPAQEPDVFGEHLCTASACSSERVLSLHVLLLHIVAMSKDSNNKASLYNRFSHVEDKGQPPFC